MKIKFFISASKVPLPKLQNADLAYSNVCRSWTQSFCHLSYKLHWFGKVSSPYHSVENPLRGYGICYKVHKTLYMRDISLYGSSQGTAEQAPGGL